MKNKERLSDTIAVSEQEYLAKYAQEKYTAIGEMVALGCWLGSTTISLAKGLEKNSLDIDIVSRKIHAFDRFIWEDWMDVWHNDSFSKKYENGESFLTEFETSISEYSEYISVHPSDIFQINWIENPIEFLLIHGMKSPELVGAISQKFFPYLIPEESLVVYQDFAHFYPAWIHLLIYRFRDYFELEDEIPNSPSVVLRYKKAIPLELLEFDYSVSEFTPQEANKAFAYSLSLVSEEKHPAIAAAQVMFYFHRNEYARAYKILDSYLEKGYIFTGYLEQAFNFINKNLPAIPPKDKIYQRQIESLKQQQKSENLEKQIQQLPTDLENSRHSLEQEKQIQQLQIDWQTSHHSLEQEQQKSANLEKQIQQLQIDLETSHHSLEQEQQKSANLEKQIQQLQIDWQTSHHSLEQEQQKSANLEKQIQQLQTDLQTSHHRLEQEQQKSANLEKQIQQLQTDLQTSHKIFNQELEKTTILGEQVQQLQIGLETSQNNLSQETEKIKNIRLELEEEKNKLRQTQQQLTITEQQLNQKQIELQKTQQQLTINETKLEQTKETIITMESSKFWQMRNQWFKLKNILGLPTK